MEILMDCPFHTHKFSYTFSKEINKYRKFSYNLICLQIKDQEPISYMRLRTNAPKPIPRNVAIEIPNIPTRIPGTTIDSHPLALAIPQAVVGPPILAFDAISNGFSSNWNSFPNPRSTIKWIVTWINANIKMLGAVWMTFHTLPPAPTTEKNTCSWSLEA